MPRPQHFDDTQGTGIEADKDFADLACGSTGWAVAFSDHGRTLVASATFGRDASPARRAEAYRILDGLNVEDQ